MNVKKCKFINRPTCAIILSILAFVFVLSAFILSRTIPPFNFEASASSGEPGGYKAWIEWSIASIYLSFMLVAAFIMFIKFRFCTWKHYKLEPNNKLLMANLIIEVLALLITIIAAFAIFMYKKEGVLDIETINNFDWLANVFKPYTILSTLSLGLSFFGSVTNLIVLAKEK